MKKIIVLIFVLVVIAGGVFYLGRQTADPNRQIEWGVTFSEKFAREMNLDRQKAYLEILDDLKVKNLRLIAYWPQIEPKENNFDFSDLDWQISQAKSRGASVVLAIGYKVPRWPECHEPDWVKNSAARNQALLNYLKETIGRYKNNSAIVAWQVENEPFIDFGECPALNVSLLDQEIALARQLDQRPVLTTDSGELGRWIPMARRGDIFGTTMYRYIWNDWTGSFKYPLPPAFFRIKEKIARLFAGDKPFWVIELQAEPWQQKQIYELTAEEQIQAMGLDKLKGIIGYAKETGFSKYYLWGAEWWYSLKQNGHPEYWNYVKTLMK